MSTGRTYYNKQSADQETYLEIEALVEAKRIAMEKVHECSGGFDDVKDPNHQLYKAIEDYGIAARRASNIRWHPGVGGWYFLDP